MATQLKLRRGTTAEHASFTGAEGEITLDTTKDTIVVHDNYTAGGRPLLREDLNNLANNSITAAKMNLGSAAAYQALRVNPAGNAVEYGYNTVGQVKHAMLLSQQVINAGTSTYVDVNNLSITMTPRSSTSKFLLQAFIQVYSRQYSAMRFTVNGTVAGNTPNGSHSHGMGSGDPYGYMAESYVYNNTGTAALTFKVQVSAYHSGNSDVYINNPSNSGASLAVWELLDGQGGT